MLLHCVYLFIFAVSYIAKIDAQAFIYSGRWTEWLSDCVCLFKLRLKLKQVGVLTDSILSMILKGHDNRSHGAHSKGIPVFRAF